MKQIYLVQSTIVENGTTSNFTVKAFSNEDAAIKFIKWRKTIITDADIWDDNKRMNGFTAWYWIKQRIQAWYIETMELENEWEE